MFKSFQLSILLSYSFFLVLWVVFLAAVTPRDLSYVWWFSDKNISLYSLELVVLGLTAFFSIKYTKHVRRLFNWLPWFVTLFSFVAYCFKPGATWVFLPIGADILWLVTWLMIYLEEKNKWLGAASLLVVSILGFGALLNSSYFNLFATHLPWVQIFPIVSESFKTGDLLGCIKYIGVTPSQGLGLVTVFFIFITYPLLLSCKFSSLFSNFSKSYLNFFAILVVSALFFLLYKPILASLPLPQVADWYVRTKILAFSDLPHLSKLEKMGIIHDKSLAIELNELYDKSSYSWDIDEKNRKNIVFLTIESWRREALEYMPFVRSLTEKGLFLSNHYSNLNESVGGDTSIFYSMFPPYIAQGNLKKDMNYLKISEAMHASAPFDCFEAFLRPSNWMTFLEESGYKFYRITETVTLQWPKYYGKSVREAEIDLGFPEKKCNGIYSERMLELLLEYMKKPGLKIVNAVLYDTHYNYSYPKEYELYKPVLETNYSVLRAYVGNNLVGLKNRYANAAYYVDSMIKVFFQKLQELKMLDDCIFIITGDHGEGMGEDGSFFHASTFHENQYQTSAILIGPNIPSQKIETVTSHEDLIPTLGLYAGYSSNSCYGVNPLDYKKNFVVCCNIGHNKTVAIRHKDYMNLFKVMSDGTLRWLSIARNNFTMDEKIYEILQEDSLDKLSQIVKKDRQLLVNYFNKPGFGKDKS